MATGSQLAGQRSETIAFVVCCSGMEQRTAINSATDIRARVFDWLLFRNRAAGGNQPRDRHSSRSAWLCFVFAIIGRATINLPEDDLHSLCFASSASRTNQSQASASITNRRQAVAGHGIEWGKTLSARLTCGSLRFCVDAAQRPR